MTKKFAPQPLFVVPDTHDEPLLAAVERALHADHPALASLPTLTELALRDPFLARELITLREQYELRPPPAHGFVARLRTRLAWWLLGAELAQTSAFHASLVRVVDSLTAHLDEERAARARLEARVQALEREP
ncbi:MAG: hypothetical protein EOM24_11990 [Chloroflexia bacterium]|nr:hypothetical protein [Chloroflexia bacterium]